MHALPGVAGRDLTLQPPDEITATPGHPQVVRQVRRADVEAGICGAQQELQLVARQVRVGERRRVSVEPLPVRLVDQGSSCCHIGVAGYGVSSLNWATVEPRSIA